MDTGSLLSLVKVASVFAFVILLLRLSFHIGLALGMGATALGLVFSMSLWDILLSFSVSLTDGKTILLILIVSLILVLSNSMEHLGLMKDLLGGFRRLIGGSRWGLLTFPALIGLLPMPGGAVFSAPMLDAFDREKRVSPSMKSFLNYWFRHVWEYAWPLFPGVLLTCTIGELDLWRFILLSLPLTGVAVLGGLPHLLRIPRDLEPREARAVERNPVNGWGPFLPIVLAILPGVGFALFSQFLGTNNRWSEWPRELWLVLGLLVAVVWTWWNRRAGSLRVRQILLDPKLARMWLTVAGAFIFKGVMEHSGAANVVGAALVQLEVPIEWVAVLLPMTIGIITGWTIAYVGICFPILVTLIQTMGVTDLKLPLMILAFACGFTGTLLSPLHLCLVLSNEYFRTSWFKVFRYLWSSGLVLLVGTIGYFGILKGLFSVS